MPKLTKIVATIGPVSDSEETIESLIEQGVNIFRFNYKHNTLQWHEERIKRVQAISEKLQTPVGTLLDLQCAEIRLTMPFDEIQIKKGEHILLGQDVFQTKEKGFSLTRSEIIDQLQNGQEVLVDAGSFSFKVKKGHGRTELISESEGVIKNRKSVSIPNKTFEFPLLDDRDFEGLEIVKRNNVSFIALSYVRDTNDIQTLREEMKMQNISAKLVSKIETKQAISNIDSIIDSSDAVMVARGDLGVEVPSEEVPYYQKLIIKKCVEKGVPVITATQMLESMTEKPIATRAEISDVANAVYDFTDALMLSGETATGLYPIETVQVMKKTAQFVEEKQIIKDTRKVFAFEVENQQQMICDAAYNLYLTYQNKGKEIGGFIVFTHTGKTATTLSRYRPHVPIYAFLPSKQIMEHLTINFGVFPILQKELEEKREVTRPEILSAVSVLIEKKTLKSGDQCIALYGDYWKVEGGTSTIKVITI